MALKTGVNGFYKSHISNDNFNMDDEETFSTGCFTIDERDQMLYVPDPVNLNNAPAPCTARCMNADDSLTIRLTNDFLHVPHNRVTPKNVIGHCKLYMLVIGVTLSVVLNIALVATGVWYLMTKHSQPPEPHPQTTHIPLITAASRHYLPISTGKVDNLVAVPCNARANLFKHFPGVQTEYVNVSTVCPENPIQQYCYLPRSEQLSHLLRIINLAKHGVNGSLGIQSKHCVSLAYSPTSKDANEFHWQEHVKPSTDNIIEVARNTRTNELELKGPSGFYLIIASTVYSSAEVVRPTPVTLEVLVNNRRMMSQTKTLLPSDQGYISLSFDDVIHTNDRDKVTFNISNAEYIYKVKQGVHTAHACCIPALGGCIK